jgi:transcriptional regulator with XRE-family HTH domain
VSATRAKLCHAVSVKDLEFGRRVTAARGERTIAEVARALTAIIGRHVNWNEVQRYERGQMPGGARLAALARALGVPIETLTGDPAPLDARPSKPAVAPHDTSLAAFYRSGIGSPITEDEHRWLASHDYIDLPIEGWFHLLLAFRASRPPCARAL